MHAVETGGNHGLFSYKIYDHLPIKNGDVL